MIVIAIAAILSIIMFNSYRSHVQKSRRTDAIQTLLSMHWQKNAIDQTTRRMVISLRCGEATPMRQAVIIPWRLQI